MVTALVAISIKGSIKGIYSPGSTARRHIYSGEVSKQPNQTFIQARETATCTCIPRLSWEITTSRNHNHSVNKLHCIDSQGTFPNRGFTDMAHTVVTLLR